MSEAKVLQALDPSSPAPAGKPTHFRWFICALLMYATTVNYIDRSILNAMAPDLQKIIGWRDYQFGLINAAFTMAYGIGFLLMGRLVDTVGTRKGYAISLTLWTLSAISTAFTSTPFQFGLTRFSLGLWEAGNYPAAIRTVAEWFPARQRAIATGFVNAGANMGAIFAPLVAACIVPFFGWRAAFLVTPIFAAIWILLWLLFYGSPSGHMHVNQAEMDLIHDDGPAAAKIAPVKWRHLLPHRQTWSFIAGKVLSDGVWGFFLFWSGKFFHDKFNVDLKGIALPLIYIYLLADIGSIMGGVYSSVLIKRGWSVNAARKTAMWTCAVLVLPVAYAPLTPNTTLGMWISASLIGLALSAHQGYSSNLFTTASDMFPKRAVSSIVGMGGVAGALGGMFIQASAGVIKEVTHSFVIMFVMASLSYVAALCVIQILVPKMDKVDEHDLETGSMPRGVTMLLAAVLGFVIGVPLSYFFQDHTLSLLLPAVAAQAATRPELNPAGPFGFPEYFSAIVTGNLFLCVDHAVLVAKIIWIPLASAAAFCVGGGLLHGLIFRNQTKAVGGSV